MKKMKENPLDHKTISPYTMEGYLYVQEKRECQQPPMARGVLVPWVLAVSRCAWPRVACCRYRCGGVRAVQGSGSGGKMLSTGSAYLQ